MKRIDEHARRLRAQRARHLFGAIVTGKTAAFEVGGVPGQDGTNEPRSWTPRARTESPYTRHLLRELAWDRDPCPPHRALRTTTLRAAESSRPRSPGLIAGSAPRRSSSASLRRASASTSLRSISTIASAASVLNSAVYRSLPSTTTSRVGPLTVPFHCWTSSLSTLHPASSTPTAEQRIMIFVVQPIRLAEPSPWACNSAR